MRLSWSIVRQVFGRDNLRYDDVLVVNGQTYAVMVIDEDGVEFEVCEDVPEQPAAEPQA